MTKNSCFRFFPSHNFPSVDQKILTVANPIVLFIKQVYSREMNVWIELTMGLKVIKSLKDK